ncbi:MAG: hypothetical protein MUF24_09590 [Chitinophagaceae bacterium]|jgi:hypothetical protein|nr:hypothetical protein [Chitinophagaceae bacterium]
MKILLFLLIIVAFAAKAQVPSGILLLKKGHRTLARFHQHQFISFQTTDGMPVAAQIERIANDSLFLIQYQVQRVQRADGAMYMDTTGKFRLQFSRANIGSFAPMRQRGRNLLTDGTLLMVGGGLYLGLNVVNTIRDGDALLGKDNSPNIIGALAVAGTGLLLKNLWRKRWVIGKTFRLQIIEPAAPQKLNG